MIDYNCPDCNEAKLQSDRNARKINEVIDQVNQIIDNDIATTEYLLEKADEIVGEKAEIKVNEELSELNKEIDNINTALCNKATKSEVNVERKRIDTFTKLSEGSTTGDAELIDGRIGADGNVYNNIGEAIRGQISTTNTKVNKVIGAFSVSRKVPFDEIQRNILYGPTFPNGTSFINYSSYIKNVKEEYEYLITSTTVANNIYCLALIYNSQNELIKVVEQNKDDYSVTFNDYKIIIPKDGVKIILSAHDEITDVSIKEVEYSYNKKYEDIENSCNKLESAFDDLLIDVHESYKEKCNIEMNKIYSTVYDYGTALDYFMTYSLKVNKGEIYEISTILPANTSYATVLFYKNGVYIGYLDKNDNEKEKHVRNYRFTVPDGVDEIKSSLYSGYSFSIYKISSTAPNMTEIVNKLNSVVNISSRFSYRVNGTSIEVISKSNGKDFYVQLMQKGGNNLFDFYRIGYIDNADKTPSSDFDNITQLSSFTTDCHCPFIICAKNNINGDQPNSNYFTGGNHQYNNQGSGSTTTARPMFLKFLIDGAEVTEGIGYGNKLEIQWSNNVQAYNTTKADGTGREVMTEYHTMTFDGDKWNTHVELMSLEDIKIATCYGFQFVTYGINKIKYVGGSNRIEYTDLTKNNDCGIGKANKIIGVGDLYNFEMELDLGYGLGASSSYKSPHAFYQSYGKVYFNLSNDIWINQGESYYYRGSYKFIIAN